MPTGAVLVTVVTVLLASVTCLVVETENGKITGDVLKSRNGRPFHSFTGIPYAKPPLGELRFKSPEPADYWGEKDGTSKVFPVCTQINFYIPMLRDMTLGQEDCLYLHVFSPKVDKNAKLPVLVYIHGGGFRCGSPGSPTRAEYMMDQDVVLVFLTYRLGALGFLSTEDEVIPGNFGLKDQSLALKWIRNNIENFGGDPESIAIFGESAGGASVHYQMMSPLSKDSFKGAISQSGTAAGMWAWSEPGSARPKAYKVAEALHCPTKSHSEMLKCLRTKDANKVIETERLFAIVDFDPCVVFQPVIESKSVPDAFITTNPINTETTKPWITGYTSREGAFKEASLLSGGAKELKRFEQLIFEETDKMLLYAGRTEDDDEVTKKIIDHYLEKGVINGSVEITSDYLIAWPTEVAIRNHKGPVYTYFFDHRAEVSVTDIIGKDLGDLGVSHGDELLSLFSFKEELPKMKGTKQDKTVSDKLIKLWINFAKYGNPTPPGSDSDITWKRRTSDREYLHIKTNEFVMAKNDNEDMLAFWDSIPFKSKKRDVKEEL